MQYIQEHPVDSSEFASILENIDTTFQPSEVYNVKADEKVIKSDVRLSEFRTLTDSKLFDLADKLITYINTKQSPNGKKFLLYRNDIMHIKYAPGGYFKSHEDYLSITSNFLEEYSLIICVKGNTHNKGGKTILKLNDFFSVKATASCIPNMSLLFRKDIPHEGEVLQEGDEKEIVTFNVWAINSEITKILKVKFRNDKRFILLNVDNIRNYPTKTLLLQFLDSNVGGNKDSNIVDYESDYSFEEFHIVANIYNGIAISYKDYTNYTNMLDFHCFDSKLLLIKAIENASQIDNNKNLVMNPAFMLFGDEMHYLEMLNKVKKDKMPMVPFRVVLAEGSLSFGGGMSGNHPILIKMQPVFASFSENNNILFVQNIMGKGFEGEPFINYFDSENSFYQSLFDSQKVRFNNLPKDSELLIDSRPEEEEIEITEENDVPILYLEDEDYNSFEGGSVNYQFACYMDNFDYSTIVKYITQRDTGKHDVRISGDYGGQESEIYVITLDNELKINPSHYEPIMTKTKEIKLFDQIIKNLNNLNIPNVQRSHESTSENYCNENVYGNFNIIMVYGFLIF